MADLNDIFSEDEKPLNDEELKKYLDEQTPEEEKHAIEKKMAASSFDNDALEGLAAFKNKDKLNEYVSHLNKNLHQKLAAKKTKKEKRKIKDISWIMIAVIIILLLVIVAYIVIRMNSGKNIHL